MRDLDAGYSVEVDRVDENIWYQLLDQFDDANIYQTWAYGMVRSGQQNISHLEVKKQGRVVAIAQSRIVKVPVIGVGIAYIMWGPLWRLKGDRPNGTVFRQAIRALRNEYAGKRGLLVRLYPALFEEDHAWLLPVLEEEGFVKRKEKGSSRTVLMDLAAPMEELQKGLRPHWQRELKVAAKQQLEVTEGEEDSLFESFIEMYKEMVERKKFQEPNNIYEFREIQRQLPREYRMKLMLCRSSDGICSGLVCSAIGSAAIYLFGATSIVGLKRRGSYLLQWKLIERLKAAHVSQYDLNGINPEANPGTYKFKSDLAGEKGKEVRFLGRFESCENRISSICVNMGEKLRSIC